MYEASKALLRRLYDSRFATRYFVGNGIDIGAGPDPIGQYFEQFPLMLSCRSWDISDGDAQYLATINDESMDFVHSSHCLEHMLDPCVALKNWIRVVKPGGHVIVTIPDEDLYEQGVFPSTFNADHKFTFTMHKNMSWSPKSMNLLSLLMHFTGIAQILKVEQIDAGYRFKLPRYDQTLTTASECALEFILRKLEPEEILCKGRLPSSSDLDERLKTALEQYELGDYSVAETIYQQLIASGAASAELFKNYGNTLLSLGRLQEAERAYRKAIELKSDFAAAFNNLGNVLRLDGRLNESELAFLEAVRLLPDSAEIHNNFGVLLMDIGQFDRAEKSYRRAILLKPDFTTAYFNRCIALRSQGRFPLAERCCRQALKLAPEYAEAHIVLGQILLQSGDPDEAEKSFLRALNIKPGSVEVYNDLGNTFLAKGSLDDAERAYRNAIALKPNYPPAQFNLSQINLLKGNFEEGLTLYENRFRGANPDSFRATNAQLSLLKDHMHWQGEQLDGRTLLVITEQGAGDSIMMMRYLPLLKQRGFERIRIYCEPELMRLFASISDVDDVISKAEPLPISGFDCFCTIMSFPFLFQTRLPCLPAHVPYLHVPDADRFKWRSLLANISAAKVGVVWAGSSHNLVDKKRSIPLSSMSPLAGVNGVQLISLQKGGQADKLQKHDIEMIDWMEMCNDFMDTAALISELDLVITVDTAVAHLTGALGKPVWLLCRFESEWRWLLDREDSPWYPSMRIFRQKARGEWDPVMNQLADELMKLT